MRAAATSHLVGFPLALCNAKIRSHYLLKENDAAEISLDLTSLSPGTCNSRRHLILNQIHVSGTKFMNSHENICKIQRKGKMSNEIFQKGVLFSV